MSDRFQDPPVRATTWTSLLFVISPDLGRLFLSGLWYLALLHSKALARSPTPRGWEDEDDDAVVWGEMLAAGTKPGWLSVPLPRMSISTLAIADGLRLEDSFILDPQRVDAGRAVFRERARERIGRLPLPFAGRLVVTAQDRRSGRRLAQRSWLVEVGTTMPVFDPDVRALMAEHRRTVRELRASLRDRDELLREINGAMITMFRESGNVILASAGLVEQAGQLRALADRLEHASAGAQLVEALRQVLPLITPSIQGWLRGAAAGEVPSQDAHTEDPGSLEPVTPAVGAAGQGCQHPEQDENSARRRPVGIPEGDAGGPAFEDPWGICEADAPWTRVSFSQEMVDPVCGEGLFDDGLEIIEDDRDGCPPSPFGDGR